MFDTVLGVNRGYFGVLQAQAYITVANETIRARQTLTDQVTALANANLKSNLDVSFANVNLSEAKLRASIRSQDAVEQAYADLARALGQDQVVHYQLASVASPRRHSSGEPGSPSSQTLSVNRPELRDLKLYLQGAQSFEKAEADQSRPNVSFIAVGGGLPYLNQDPRIAPSGYEGAAVNVEILIFNDTCTPRGKGRLIMTPSPPESACEISSSRLNATYGCSILASTAQSANTNATPNSC